MKRTAFILLALFYISVGFAVTNLLNVNFASGFPSGWTMEGITGNWQISATANAGGTSPELKFANTPSTTGTRRYISPAVNTMNHYELQLRFNQFINDNPASPNYPQAFVQISNDLTNWDTVWSSYENANYGPIETTLIISPLNQYYYTNVSSATFYIAFGFADTGSPNDLLGWYLDNISLDAVKPAISGTWTAGSTHYIDSDCGVPYGQSLIIQPGVQVIFQGNYSMVVNGVIQAGGTEANPILFTAGDHYVGWKGLVLYYNQAGSAINHCRFEWGNNVDGGVLSAQAPQYDLLIEDCTFSNNVGYMGSAISASAYGNITINRCRFENNSGYNGTTIFISTPATATLSNSIIANNMQSNYMANDCHIKLQPISQTGKVVFESNTVVGNTGCTYTCRTDGYDMMNMHFLSFKVNNSIFINEACSAEFYFWQAFDTAVPRFSYNNILNLGILGATPNLLANIDEDPLFVGNGDYNLLPASPCINTGNPTLTDPDGTRKDMGALPATTNPVIQAVNDVPFDQGLRTEVFWSRSYNDVGSIAGSYYSVWREDNFRSGSGTVINSPLEIYNLSSRDNVYWIDRDTAWLYLGDTPAISINNYAFICPTLQDSSATGTHAANFQVVFVKNSTFAKSIPVSGYSVDNIAPDPVRNLTIAKNSNIIRLDWSAVTAGTFNGSSYPELGAVSYKVYSSDTAYFEPGPANYLTTTNSPFQLIDYLGEARKFFRIVAVDK